MHREPLRIRQSRSLRWLSALLLFAVFFLPLHYHAFTPTAQVAKECSCAHGTRTQLVWPADLPTIAPIFLATFFAALYVFSWAGDWSKLQNVRGPPALLSV